MLATPHTAPPSGENWRAELAAAYTRVEDLVGDGLLSAAEAVALAPVAARYQLSIPRYYAALMDRTAPARCPIRLQALPHPGEGEPGLPPWARAWSLRAFGREVPWTSDPIGDLARLAAPRLTHRYGNRVILHVSAACALYCRFCFRKSHLNATEEALYKGQLAPAIAYLQAHPEVREVILTGGDPLSVPDGPLARLLGQLEAIPHIKRVRIHSRMPVTLPARLTAELADLLANRRFTTCLVAHFNHPRELTPVALAKLERLRRRGVVVYNQAVLLRGINNHEDTLFDLFQTLYEAGVTPYYLHHPDWTPGTFHFRVPIAQGRALMTALSGRLSGPAVPHYVLDVPGGHGKVRLLDASCTQLEERVTPDLAGALHRLALPNTRAGSDAPALYAEFWAP